MKITLFFLALCVAVSLAAAVRDQSDRSHILINRPKIDEFGPRSRRAAWPLTRADGVKGGVQARRSKVRPSSLETNLRKGEYICEGKVCKLAPGEKPEGCDFCQYPV
ncbi:hypothetical protein PYW08_009010 [Mythimna loreyi]|uniref:Uncharacterized protein n=1 Tax=Mythimna loreyi TaxID=667449 RepID=A0ACC2Q7J2_9NEOP|nr:hypothetical protein PYW08_009010 [Mythimna loreyi]